MRKMIRLKLEMFWNFLLHDPSHTRYKVTTVYLTFQFTVHL